MRFYLLAIAFLFSAHPAATAADSNPLLEAGIPAPSRSWSGPDYARTNEVLAGGKVALPRYSDPAGAAVLRRLTSTDNFSLHYDKTIALPTRMEDFLELQKGASSLLKLYLDALVKGGDYKTEIAHLSAFVLHSSALGVDLVDEMLPTIPRDDKYETRMAGLKQMNSGLTTVFVGAEQMLTPRNGFSPEDLSVLLEAMTRTLPRLKKAFPPDYRIELRKKLEADKVRFKGEDARRIDEMIRELGS
jgi:hypothetical protein